ncbi:unnamed protein product, partial [marine sediment metagenome]
LATHKPELLADNVTKELEEIVKKAQRNLTSSA